MLAVPVPSVGAEAPANGAPVFGSAYTLLPGVAPVENSAQKSPPLKPTTMKPAGTTSVYWPRNCVISACSLRPRKATCQPLTYSCEVCPAGPTQKKFPTTRPPAGATRAPAPASTDENGFVDAKSPTTPGA